VLSARRWGWSFLRKNRGAACVTDHESSIFKSRFVGQHFFSDNLDKISRALSLEAIDFREIVQNNGHYAGQGLSMSLILVPTESPYATFY